MHAPIGVIVDAVAVVLGGVVGALAGGRLTDNFKDKMNLVFAVCSLSMGISTIVLMKNMPAVVLSLIVGTAIGAAFHLEDSITVAAGKMQKMTAGLFQNAGEVDDDFAERLVTVLILFCASGTGIYGSLISGMTGDQSVLLAKAILDFCSAIIFSCSLGMVVSFVAIPQAIIFLLLFALARVIFPLTTPAMVADFKACGGMIMLATGFRMMKRPVFPIGDMLPAMLLIMPVSWAWTSFIVPLVG